MTAERNSFHRCSGSPTICSDTNAIWEISVKRIIHLVVNSCSQEIYLSEVAAEFVLKLTRDTYHPRLTSEFPGYADIDAGARIAIYDNEYGYWRHEIGYICKTFEFLSIPRPQSVFAMGRNGHVQPGQPDSPRKDLTGLLRPNAKLWKFEGPGFAIDTGRFTWPPKDGSEVPREGPLTGSVELMMPDLPETQDATTIDVDLQISYTFVDRANIVLAAPPNCCPAEFVHFSFISTTNKGRRKEWRTAAYIRF